MKKSDFQKHMSENFHKLMELSKAGQKEYALSEDAFDNFNRLGAEMSLDRKKVLWVYLRKHLDGITSYLNGHRSQRESVHGRIHDAIVYLQILDAMIAEEEMNEPVEMMPGKAVRLNPNEDFI